MMITKCIVFPLLVIVSTMTFAQTSEKYEHYRQKTGYEPGYIEKYNGDKVAGLIKTPRIPRAHVKVVFVSKHGIKSTYSPTNLKAYGTDYEQYESDQTHFLKVVTKSNGIGLYQLSTNSNWTTQTESYGESMRYASLSVSYYIKRSLETKFVAVEGKQFEETFLDYFNDCSALQSKIKEQKFTHNNVREMVKFYQYSCRKQEAMNVQRDRF